MSTIGWIIVAIIVVVVVIALIALAMAMRKRRHERLVTQASELRSEALGRHGDVASAHRDAAEAEAKAKLARTEAERAEAEAAHARGAAAQEEAHQENALREADRVDPRVDHTADDYRPGATVPPDGASGTSTTGGPAGPGEAIGHHERTDVPAETAGQPEAERSYDGPTFGAHRKE